MVDTVESTPLTKMLDEGITALTKEELIGLWGYCRKHGYTATAELAVEEMGDRGMEL
jgi:hypothetical protein